LKTIHIFFVVFSLLFGLLFSFRAGLFENFYFESKKGNVARFSDLPEKETWMNVWQNDRKIGFSHTRLLKEENGYLIKEDLFMRINTIGFSNDLMLKTTGRLNPDLTLSTFDFSISSGRFQFAAHGKVSDKTISIKTDQKQLDIRVDKKPFLASGIIHTIVDRGMGPGDSIKIHVFSPASMNVEPVNIMIVGKEDITNMGLIKPATKVEIKYMGTSQYAWIGEGGDILREQGMLGLKLEKTTRKDALFGLPIESSSDLTEIASVASNVRFDDPGRLVMIKVNISGIELNEKNISGNRQHLEKNMLTIRREDLTDLANVVTPMEIQESMKAFLAPSTFIESDHPEIKKQAQMITAPDDNLLVKAKKIVGWAKENIEKRPVLSVPDALSTLRNRQGDCNEHAVLTAALARAAGIPAKVEAGLVYMKGRFYYHAWNNLFLGQWITADATFGTLPADVTHIRLSSGLENIQSDIMGTIDKIHIEVIDYSYD